MKNFSFLVFLFSGSIGCQIQIDEASRGDNINDVKNCELIRDDCEEDPELWVCSDLNNDRYFLTTSGETITYSSSDLDEASCACFPSLC